MQQKTVGGVTLCLAAASVLGGEIVLSRQSIDGGGVMRSTGGAFELSGTIGQPDAGVLSGANLELSGGFWFGLAPADCDEDGAIGPFDHGNFSACFAGPAGGLIDGCGCFDLDPTGSIDLRDFAALQAAFDSP